MTSGPRLLLLNYEYPPIGGGAANATLFLAQAWARRGCRPVVVTSGHADYVGIEDSDGVQVHRLNTGRAAADRGTLKDMGRYIAAAMREGPRIARDAGCTATVAFFTLPSGLVATWIKTRLGLPYIISLRGSDVPGHDQTLNRIHLLTQPMRRLVLRRAKAIVANSEGLASTSRAADPFPIEIVPNGVDCTRFTPPPPAPLRDSFVLLFVGRVHREKNLKPVIEALRGLPGIRLVVAGDGPQRTELEAVAKSARVDGQIEWLGWQGKNAVPALYRRADALINPSLYEGMPNVVLEGMASGLPVIASDTPGNRSVVTADETGLLFPLGESAALAESLRRMSTDAGLRRRLGLAGRMRAERDFSWDSAAARYLELLSR